MLKNSLQVPKVGIEPTHQWYTILSRARLPIPPLRLLFRTERKCKAKINFSKSDFK